MEITSELDQMTDHSRTSRIRLSGCYLRRRTTGVRRQRVDLRDQVARAGRGQPALAEQTVVLYPARQAHSVLGEIRVDVKQCGSAVSVDDGQSSYTWQLDDLEVKDQISAPCRRTPAGWECQHAMSYVPNVTVEAWACSYGINDEAAGIVQKMIDKRRQEEVGLWPHCRCGHQRRCAGQYSDSFSLSATLRDAEDGRSSTGCRKNSICLPSGTPGPPGPGVIPTPTTAPLVRRRLIEHAQTAEAGTLTRCSSPTG